MLCIKRKSHWLPDARKHRADSKLNKSKRPKVWLYLQNVTKNSSRCTRKLLNPDCRKRSTTTSPEMRESGPNIFQPHTDTSVSSDKISSNCNITVLKRVVLA
ncbi:hypothetical protein AOLI_G00169520 [Acnodon oligacanthus]